MIYDAFTIAVIAIGSGISFGAIQSVFGFLKGTDPFNPRKFAVTVLTGIGAGIVLVFTQMTDIVAAEDNFDLLIAIGGLAFAIFGVNWLRTTVSELTANRAVEKIEETL
jgi:hypothetical protein